MEILLKDIKGKFDLVLEGYDLLHREIQSVRHELLEKIDYNSFLIEAVNKKVDHFRDEFTQQIQVIDKKVDTLRDDLTQQIQTVDKKVDASREDSSHQIQNLDIHLSERIDILSENLAAHRADTESHTSGHLSSA